jgi:hypothetical protein
MDFEKNLVFRPHHTKSIDRKQPEYHPLSPKRSVLEIDCSCLGNDFSDTISDLNSSAHPTLLWLDPQLMATECLAAFVNSWKENSNATSKIALAILVPKGCTSQKAKVLFEPWRIEGSKLSYNSVLNEPVWYPSLARNVKSLQDAAAYLHPYDVFPLVEFPEFLVEWGEETVANHYSMLEQFRTRTRNFIYIDMSHPDRAFLQFYATLNALRQSGTSVFQPVITPGGDITTFLITLLAGVLAGAYFLTPKVEIPINTKTDANGVMILRKCV